MLNNRGKKVLAVIIFLLIIISVFFTFQKYFITFFPNDVIVTNFDECVGAGFPIVESYPRQCMTSNGENFIENILDVTTATSTTAEIDNMIILTSPEPNQEITSPVQLIGKARGNWFFEASFPVFLTDWDGKIIAEGVAQAEGEWMTEDFVPFNATLTYVLDPNIYSNKGTLILKKDNPSGLPENDDALEIPVLLK